jgi:hypothetical protein
MRSMPAVGGSIARAPEAKSSSACAGRTHSACTASLWSATGVWPAGSAATKKRVS